MMNSYGVDGRLSQVMRQSYLALTYSSGSNAKKSGQFLNEFVLTYVSYLAH